MLAAPLANGLRAETGRAGITETYGPFKIMGCGESILEEDKLESTILEREMRQHFLVRALTNSKESSINCLYFTMSNLGKC